MAKALIVEILADAKQFVHELDKAAGKTHQFSKAAGVAGLALGGALAFGLEKSVHAAMDAQVSTAKMDTAYKAAGLSADVYANKIAALEQAGNQLGFMNSDIRDSLGSLIVATHNQAQASRDLGVAEDIARFKHIGLTDAAKVLTMTMSGSTRAAHMLGIQTQSVTTAQDKVNAAYAMAQTRLTNAYGSTSKMTNAQKLEYAQAQLNLKNKYASLLATAKLTDKNAQAAKVVDLVSQKLHGQAQAYSQTAAGGMARFHAETESLQENLGKLLLPAIEKVIGALADAAAWLGKHKTIAEILVIALGALAVAMMAVSAATAIWTTVSTLATAATTALSIALVNLPFVAIAAVIAVAAYEIYKHWSGIAAFFTNLWHEVEGAFTDAWNWLEGIWRNIEGLFDTAIQWVSGHWKIFLGLPGLIWQYWGTITGWFGKLWSGITGAFASAIGWIKREWGALIGWLTEMIRPLVDAYNAVAGWATGNINLPHSGGSSGPAMPKGMNGPVGPPGPHVRGASHITVQVGPVHGTADPQFAEQLAGHLATALRGGRVPQLQQAIAAV